MLNKIEQCPYQIKVTTAIKLSESVIQNKEKRRTDSSGKLETESYSVFVRH